MHQLCYELAIRPTCTPNNPIPISEAPCTQRKAVNQPQHVLCPVNSSSMTTITSIQLRRHSSSTPTTQPSSIIIVIKSVIASKSNIENTHTVHSFLISNQAHHPQHNVITSSQSTSQRCYVNKQNIHNRSSHPTDSGGGTYFENKTEVSAKHRLTNVAFPLPNPACFHDQATQPSIPSTTFTHARHEMPTSKDNCHG